MTNNLEFAPTIENRRESTRALGALSLLSSEANMMSVLRPGESAFYFMPGWHSDGMTLAANFDKHVEHFGSTHFSVHPAGEFSVDAHKEQWLKARRKDGFRPAKVYAQSQGVLTASEMFADPLFRDDFGEVESVVFDSGASNWRDVQPDMLVLMLVCMGMPRNKAAEKVNEWVLKNSLKKEYDFGEGVTALEAYENNAASAKTTLLACQTQLGNIWRRNLANFDLVEFGAGISNKKIISSSHDAVINNTRSASVINYSYGGGFTHLVDPRRKPKDHATGTEHPLGVIDALMDRNHDHYQTVDIREYVAKKGIIQRFRERRKAT